MSMSDIIQKALAAAEEEAQLEQAAKRARKAEIARRIARHIEDWFDCKIEPVPSDIPFVYGGLSWFAKTDFGDLDITVQWPDELFYDSEGVQYAAHVSNAADVGSAIAEDISFREDHQIEQVTA